MTDAAVSPPPAPAVAAPSSGDDLFGVCAAVGEDFGFDPLYLRVAFAVALLFALEAVLLVYAGLGLVVLASRLLFPEPRPVAVAAPLMAAPGLVDEPEFRRAA
jgi:phage shock protein PspC (stress-responsive transcriptional regulator)